MNKKPSKLKTAISLVLDLFGISLDTKYNNALYYRGSTCGYCIDCKHPADLHQTGCLVCGCCVDDKDIRFKGKKSWDWRTALYSEDYINCKTCGVVTKKFQDCWNCSYLISRKGDIDKL